MTAAPAASAALAWQTATIARIVARTPRITSFYFDAPLARHRAGQHVDVRLTAVDGYQAERSYSIASAPGDGPIELAIERLDDGEVSPYFHDVAAVGDTLELRGPIGGHFVWEVAQGGPVLLVGGGSGIAPLMAMARANVSLSRAVPMAIAQSARTWDDVLFRDELFALEARSPDITVTLATTREAPRRPQDHARRFDAPIVASIVARLPAPPRHVYVCGTNGFVEAVTGDLVRMGIEPARVRTERYGGA
ncbi:MAG TPA: FAD-binding oxidoreductase [Casimicrobiaceae bacterium]